MRRGRRVRLARDDRLGAKRFTGEIDRVEIDLGLDDHNHLIKPDDRVNLASGIQ